ARGRGLRGGWELSRPGRSQDAGSDARGQELDAPRRSRTPDEPGREPPHDRRQRHPLQGAGQGSDLRRRAFLRRLSARSSVRVGDARRGRGRGGRLRRAVRYQRRRPPYRRGSARLGGAGPHHGAPGYSPAQRQRSGARERPRRRRGWLRPRPGNHQRIRRALRQLGPGPADRHAAAQARIPGARAGTRARAARRRALRGGRREPEPRSPRPLRGPERLRTQRRDPRRRRGPSPRELPAHRSGARGEREASVTLRVGEVVTRATAEGAGPVNALDRAVRETLVPHYPQLALVRLVDYKVRIVDDHLGTAAKPRVLIESARGDERWSTVGCSENILEASWQALRDALELPLLRRPD